MVGMGLLLAMVNLPGVLLVFFGILLTAIQEGFERFTPGIVLFFFVLAIGSLFLDNLAMLIGGRRFGASKWGMLGAIVGSIVGLVLFQFIGLFLGAFFGAVALEMSLGGKESRHALHAGVGSFLGLMVGFGFKFAITVAMIVAWVRLAFV